VVVSTPRNLPSPQELDESLSHRKRGPTENFSRADLVNAQHRVPRWPSRLPRRPPRPRRLPFLAGGEDAGAVGVLDPVRDHHDDEHDQAEDEDTGEGHGRDCGLRIGQHPVSDQLGMVDLAPPASLQLPDAVWGVDPSTLRVATGLLSPSTAGPRVDWAVCSLPKSPDPARWFYNAYATLARHYLDLVAEHGAPLLVFVEEPFGGGGSKGQKRTVHPSSNRMLGVVFAALGRAIGLEGEVGMVGPSSWKLAALGKGHGHAQKDEIMAWAQAAGYTGSLQDEADAIGIATAAGVQLVARSA
jgi:hypothetical protein